MDDELARVCIRRAQGSTLALFSMVQCAALVYVLRLDEQSLFGSSRSVI